MNSTETKPSPVVVNDDPAQPGILAAMDPADPPDLAGADLSMPGSEGCLRTRRHFRNSSEHAILQIPGGCGKRDLMSLLPFTRARAGKVGSV